MTTYVITNRQPNGYTGSPDEMQRWVDWFGRLGQNLVDPGNPVFERTTIGDCGPGTQLGGFTIIEADDLEHAAALAATCPAVSNGGGVEVGELTPLNRAG